MKLGRILVAALSACSFVVGVACDEGASSTELGNADAEPPPLRGGDAGAPDGALATPMTIVRFAHLAPDIGPVDFCFRGARTGTFTGPVLRGSGTGPVDAGANPADASPLLDASTLDASGDDAGRRRAADALTVTRYLELPAIGSITFAIVAAGSAACVDALHTATVTLDPGRLSTVALFGSAATDGGLELGLGAFTDDPRAAEGDVRVRVIHAALGNRALPSPGALGIRVASGKTTVLAERVEPRRASTESPAVPVDALGYVTAGPVAAPAQLAIGPATTDGGADAGFEPWQSAPVDLALVSGAVHTAFVVSGDEARPFAVLWCADRTTNGEQTECSLLR